MKKAKEKAYKRGIKVKEYIWYIIASLLALAGLVMIILGIVANYLPLDNKFVIATKEFAKVVHLSYINFGLIFVFAGGLIAVIVLAVFAKNADRQAERSQRRALRLAGLEEEKPTDSSAKE